MRSYYVTFRSVTHAQRGERVLQNEKIHCTLQRTPRWMEAQGCGYSLRLWTEDVRTGVDALRKAGVPLRKIYVQMEDGGLEEMAL